MLTQHAVPGAIGSEPWSSLRHGIGMVVRPAPRSGAQAVDRSAALGASGCIEVRPEHREARGDQPPDVDL